MRIFRLRHAWEKPLNEVRERSQQTASELSRVKIRQENIERRLKFLLQELQVQQRNL